MKYKLKVFNRHTKDFKYEITENGHTMIPEDVVKGLNDKELLLSQKVDLEKSNEELTNKIMESILRQKEWIKKLEG